MKRVDKSDIKVDETVDVDNTAGVDIVVVIWLVNENQGR